MRPAACLAAARAMRCMGGTHVVMSERIPLVHPFDRPLVAASRYQSYSYLALRARSVGRLQ